MVPQATRPGGPQAMARHTAPVRLRLAQPNVEPNGGEITFVTFYPLISIVNHANRLTDLLTFVM